MSKILDLGLFANIKKISETQWKIEYFALYRTFKIARNNPCIQGHTYSKSTIKTTE